MIASTPPAVDAAIRSKLMTILGHQQAAMQSEAVVTLATRIDRLDRAIDALVRNSDRAADALRADFGCRPHAISKLVDVAASIEPLKYARRHVERWMSPERHTPMFPLNLMGASARVEYQPLGIVGIMAPWNFPMHTVFSPLSGVLAAGNRAMIKPSEYTPATAALMAEMIAEAFDPTEIAVTCGDTETGRAFASLPLDHLMFTGSAAVAREVMRAAAENLVPVTLELGGKSPVVLSTTAPLRRALDRIMVGKTINAGQVCMGPDYLFVHEDALDDTLAEAHRSAATMFPTMLENPEYSAIISERHHRRLLGYIDEAKTSGHTVLSINPAGEDFSNQTGAWKIPPTLIVNPSDDLRVMQEEIFGPVLPVKTYRSFDEVIAFINGQPHALAAYYFGHDATEERRFIAETRSGGVCINDVIFQVTQESLPFGGVGPSGMGAYHGIQGFKTMSHAKSVYRQTRVDIAKLGGLVPPFNRTTDAVLKFQIKR
ncbi:MAG: coniferyl aldehyde dehydrogenase [Myxococcota bacterium]|nr:coniferyl aldehyde dehydrogenase [Myxococcota bacterium]MEC9389237.1 coniferyl aldehyde dehydrogenase [Myxococcota bacterium]